jgi:hypothetical protein
VTVGAPLEIVRYPQQPRRAIDGRWVGHHDGASVDWLRAVRQGSLGPTAHGDQCVDGVDGARVRELLDQRIEVQPRLFFDEPQDGLPPRRARRRQARRKVLSRSGCRCMSIPGAVSY